jgi:NAD kinase
MEESVLGNQQEEDIIIKEKEEIEEIEEKTIFGKPTIFNYSKVGFIINPHAGKGKSYGEFKKHLPIIKKKFEGRAEICCYLTKKINDASRLVKKYIENGFDLIVSVGGDGTNNEVLNVH